MKKAVLLVSLGLLVGCGRAEVRPFPVLSGSGSASSRYAAAYLDDQSGVSRVITPTYEQLRAQVAVPLVTGFEDRRFGAGDTVSSSTALGRAKTEVKEANDDESIFTGTLPGGSYTLKVNNKAKTYSYSAAVVVDAVITQDVAYPALDYINYMRRYAILSTFEGQIVGKNTKGEGRSLIFEFVTEISRGQIRSKTDFDLTVNRIADAVLFVTDIKASSQGVNATVSQSGIQWNQITRHYAMSEVMADPTASNVAMWGFMRAAVQFSSDRVDLGYQESVPSTVQFKNGQMVSN